MATIERALNAHSLYWVKDEKGDRIGIVWGLDGHWRWTVGQTDSREADSFEAAKAAVEAMLGERVRVRPRGARAAA
ncbi:MAG: hypothetical protein H6872_14645 [Methylobacteriaceae bacterium]|nr:hypothetical protein [Methylobacteriaceae bacterium]